MSGSSPEPELVVSLTPLAVEHDSRTYKQAASVARLGYRSVVVEGGMSRGLRHPLPFELVSAGTESVAAPARSIRRASAAAAPLPGFVRRAGEYAARLVFGPPAYARKMIATARATPKARVYWLHSYLQAPVVLWRTARGRGAFVYDAHDFYPALVSLERRAWVDRLLATPQRLLERLTARRAAVRVTVSDGVARLAEHEFGRPFAVIQNAVDARLGGAVSQLTVRDAAGVPPGSLLFVMVGNAKPGLPLDVALDALALLPGVVHFAWIGRGYEDSPRRAAERDVGTRAHFLAPVPPTQVTDFIRSADAGLVLYSPRNSNLVNALPNGLFHVLAAGLPVVHSPLEHIAAVARRYDAGVEADPLDPASIAAAVGRLAGDEELRRRLADGAARAGRELTWEADEPVLAAALESALAAGTASR